MEPEDYRNRLYPLQDHVIAVLRSLDTGFYLTGGTAASRGYLHHRFSDDLDFFVNDDPRFGLWSARVVAALVSHHVWRVEPRQRDERFVRVEIFTADLPLKIEMVNDVPAHVGEIREHALLGRLDTPENILANKVSAVLDRREPKDLADIWGFCCRLQLSLRDALGNAQSKAAGVFPADLARVLLSADENDWRAVRWANGPTVEEFLRGLSRLGEDLLLGDEIIE